jgi:DNA-binding NarL/FixJ family response regulator
LRSTIRRAVSSLQSIAQLLHLPLGAAKVVAALLDGIELKEYAEREGISPNTVKFHLKTAFERTGSRSQTDLVRRALRMLADLDV